MLCCICTPTMRYPLGPLPLCTSHEAIREELNARDDKNRIELTQSIIDHLNERGQKLSPCIEVSQK